MPTHTQVPQVSARIGALVVQVAAARGVEAQRLMTDSGFAPDWLSDAEARMPLAVEERLWNRAAELTADPLFGLHAALAIRPGAFDVLDYAVRTAANLRTALHRLARYNRLVHDLATFEIVAQDDIVRIEHRFDGAGTRPCRQAAEFTLASLVVVASQMAEQPVHPLAVEFAHAPADDSAATQDAYRAVFGIAPRFGAPISCVVFSAEMLERPVPAADPTLSRIVTAHAEQLLAAHAPAQEGIAEQVRRLLAEGMSNGPMSLAQTAQRLHMSERSLQRRLDDEGTRFADLMDEVRRELALRYISDARLSLGEVAFLLGFAEPSPFHRAFKRWTGMTPSAARRARQTG
ncbi:AraC family transcriptional regulator [Aquabacterium sp.]|uniref:AraC family transcriptional regulator n=1 Tax=Aquabacterium sp. TaxID=1872578 RepID=UPI002E2FF15A|nr:AraC family transcriptional regulator [Aquabacterium sp.]HEX5311832.1 AraC family transcriptional regulator [Aquabacterium sp.]